MHSKRPRLHTFDYIGKYRYFLTLCTHDREDVFTNDTVVDLVWGQILPTARAYGFSIPSYVFMPDHAHFLFKAERDDSDLRACVAMCKQKSAYAYSQKTGSCLWQPSFYDRVLRDGETDIFVIRYIFDNPVRGARRKLRGLSVPRLRNRICRGNNQAVERCAGSAVASVMMAGRKACARDVMAGLKACATGVMAGLKACHYSPAGAWLGPRRRNCPPPLRPTNLSPSMMTSPREMTAEGDPCTVVPSYGL
jgi:REP element-mobilizing transposase RayT